MKDRARISIRSVLTCKTAVRRLRQYWPRPGQPGRGRDGEAVGCGAAQSMASRARSSPMRTSTPAALPVTISPRVFRVWKKLSRRAEPKHHAIMAEVEGDAEVEDTGKGMRKVAVLPSEGQAGRTLSRTVRACTSSRACTSCRATS